MTFVGCGKYIADFTIDRVVGCLALLLQLCVLSSKLAWLGSLIQYSTCNVSWNQRKLAWVIPCAHLPFHIKDVCICQFGCLLLSLHSCIIEIIPGCSVFKGIILMLCDYVLHILDIRHTAII
jgi:hypothetical protein